MKKNSQRAILVLALALVSCGDDGVVVLPTANLVRDGAGAWQDCSTISCASNPPTFDFVGDARNLGPGCATSVRGVVKFVDAAGVQLGPTESWSLLSSSRVLRSGEAFTFLVLPISESIMDATATTDQEFSWTNVGC